MSIIIDKIEVVWPSGRVITHLIANQGFAGLIPASASILIKGVR